MVGGGEVADEMTGWYIFEGHQRMSDGFADFDQARGFAEEMYNLKYTRAGNTDVLWMLDGPNSDVQYRMRLRRSEGNDTAYKPTDMMIVLGDHRGATAHGPDHWDRHSMTRGEVVVTQGADGSLSSTELVPAERVEETLEALNATVTMLNGVLVDADVEDLRITLVRNEYHTIIDPLSNTARAFEYIRAMHVRSGGIVDGGA